MLSSSFTLALLLVFARVSAAVDEISVIRTDVVVVGGGASGAHAAFRLQEDFGKSVVLIEKRSMLVRWARSISLNVAFNADISPRGDM